MSSYTERLQMLEVQGRHLAAAFHDAGNEAVVVFCHGFRGERTGPNRFFVRAARQLADSGVSSLRFDQFGSGDSEGDFLSSSFTDWVETCRTVAESYLDQGRRVALFGQSMGGSAVLCAAAELSELAAVVAWVPDPNVDPFTPARAGFVEEGGQLVQNRFWQEAREADVPDRLERLAVPAYLVFGTDDAYVSEDNRQALAERAKPHHVVDVFEGYAHSAWTYAQATGIIDRSVRFLTDQLITG